MYNKKIVQIWINEHFNYLYNYASSRMPEPESAKDILQDTFIAAYLNVTSFKENSSVRTWLIGILRRKISDYYRRELKDVQAINDYYHLNDYFDSSGKWNSYNTPGEVYIDISGMDDDFQALLYDCIYKLPIKLKKAILLKYYDNRKAQYICQELDITPTNLWQIMHRAKIRLRGCIEHNSAKS